MRGGGGLQREREGKASQNLASSSNLSILEFQAEALCLSGVGDPRCGSREEPDLIDSLPQSLLPMLLTVAPAFHLSHPCTKGQDAQAEIWLWPLLSVLISPISSMDTCQR